MPIDARIALGAQAPQMAQPMELYGNALKLQSMQRQNALAEQEMAAAQTNQRRQAELLNFMQSAKDPYAEDVQMQLPRFGQPGIDMAAKLEERNRYRSETKLKQAEHEAKTLELTQSMLPAAMNDPNHYARVVEFVRSRDPAMADRMPPWSREGVLNLMTTAKDMVAQHRMTSYEARPVATETAYGVEGITPTGETVWKRRAPPKAPGTVVNVGDKGNIAATEGVVNSLIRTREGLAQAPTLWQNLEDAKDLIPQAKNFMGAGGEFSLEAASFLNNRFGTNIDVSGVKNATELRSRMFQGIVSTLKQLDSNPSQSQQAALQQALGGLGTDPSAMEKVINVAQDIISGRVERYNKDATKASQKLDFPIDMPIEMPTRTAPTATGAPPPPPGFKIR